MKSNTDQPKTPDAQSVDAMFEVLAPWPSGFEPGRRLWRNTSRRIWQGSSLSRSLRPRVVDVAALRRSLASEVGGYRRGLIRAFESAWFEHNLLVPFSPSEIFMNNYISILVFAAIAVAVVWFAAAAAAASIKLAAQWEQGRAFFRHPVG